MKTLAVVALLLATVAASGEEKKPKTDPRSFRMPKAAKPQPAPSPVVIPSEVEGPGGSGGTTSVVRDPALPAPSTDARADVKSDPQPEAAQALPFRLPNDGERQQDTPEPEAVTPQAAPPVPFTLPGQAVVPATKKKPKTAFQLPNKK